MQVNRKLKGKLVESGKTYKDCAEALNISITTFSNKMNRKTPFTVVEAGLLVEFLNLPSNEGMEIFLI